jgi:hypothetical protein
MIAGLYIEGPMTYDLDRVAGSRLAGYSCRTCYAVSLSTLKQSRNKVRVN